MTSFTGFVEDLVCHIHLFKTSMPSQLQVVAKWGHHGRPLPIPSFMTFEICVQRDCCYENHDYWHWTNGTITIKPLGLHSQPFSLTLALVWVGSTYRYRRRLGWGEPRTNLSHTLWPRTLSLSWNHVIRFIQIVRWPGKPRSRVKLKSGDPLICLVKVIHIAPLIHGVTIKCSPGLKKNHF